MRFVFLIFKMALLLHEVEHTRTAVIAAFVTCVFAYYYLFVKACFFSLH